MKRNNAEKWMIVLINIVLLIILVLWRGITWESNDDPTIAFILYQYGPDSTPYVNPVYLKLVYELYTVSNSLNWWLIFTLLAIFASTFVVWLFALRYTYKKSRHASILFTLLATNLIYFFCIQNINFTKTAVCVTTAGVILLQSALDFKNKTQKIYLSLIGMLLILWGFAYRFKGGLMVAPFVVTYYVTYMIRTKKWSDGFRKLIIVGSLSLLSVAISYVGERTKSDELVEFEAGPSQIDYPYIINADEEELSKSGLSVEDINYYLTWRCFDTDVFSDENVEIILNSVQKNNTISYFLYWMKINVTSVFFTVAFIFFVTLFFQKKFLKDSVFHIVLCILLILGFGLYGRIIKRIFDVLIFLCATFSLITYCNLEYDEDIENIDIKANRRSTAVAVMGILCIFVIITYKYGEITFNLPNSGNESVYRETMNQLAETDDIYYVYIWEWLGLVYPDNIFKNSEPLGVGKNIFPLSGWVSTLPCVKSTQENLGINNPSKAILYKNGVMAIYDDELVQFLSRHYGKVICRDICDYGSIQIANYEIGN